MTQSKLKPLPVWSLSLGCPKNRVDSERLLGSLGCPIKIVPHIGRSKLVFINTCAFIEPAVKESIRAILDSVEAIKKLKKKPLVVVAGCLPGRYDEAELRKELPEVDLWLQPNNISDWASIISDNLKLDENSEKGRLISTPPSYSWLKIADGCRHNCSFCAIPMIRGKLKSENPQKILKEAEQIIKSGIKELILVAQDVTAWGSDFVKNKLANSSDLIAKPSDLPELIRELAKLSGLEWLRLLYLYPDSISDELLATMAEIGKPVLPYLDIPLQHSESRILASMGRPFKIDIRDTIEKIYKFLPDAALRTTFIVGYPGETETDFKNLCKFVQEMQFQNMGVFAFQPEEGTKAANFADQVPPELKEERREELMAIQATISRNNLRKYVGKRLEVLVDQAVPEIWPGLHYGRVWFQAPEVDGITYVSGPAVKPGALLKCDIEESHDYDLTALA